MNKTIILIFLAFCAILPAMAQTRQTKVNLKGEIPNKIQLRFTKMEWDSLDIINLYTHDGRAQELICSFNPWYGDTRSRIEYKNQYKIRVAQFALDDHACLKLFNFAKIAFEGVNDKNPIIVEIDTQQNFITNIELPGLDFYEKDANLFPDSKIIPANF